MPDPAAKPAVRLAGWLLILMLPVAIVALTETALRLVGLGQPVLYVEHPDYQYAPRPDQRTERRRGAVVTIDEHGLRTAGDWDAPADLRILFVGDSVTYGGSYVDDTELFSARVCAELSGSHGIDANCGNAGVNAYGTDNMAARIRADDHGADLIVAVVLPGDTLRGLRPLQGLPFYTEPMPEPVPAIAEAAQFGWRWLTIRLHKLSSAAAPAQDGISSDLEGAIDDRIDRLLQALAGRRALLVLTPARAAIAEADPVTRQVRARFAASGLPFLDMTPALRGQDLDAIYYDDVHLDPSGHALYAKVMAERIAAMLSSSGPIRPARD